MRTCPTPDKSNKSTSLESPALVAICYSNSVAMIGYADDPNAHFFYSMPHPAPVPSASIMDAQLWDSGYDNARIPGNPHELDFLRGFHSLTFLTNLRNWLQVNSGFKIQLTSVWQDKFGNVVPNPLAPGQQYKYQEVADLAVIVRDAVNSKASARMWLLQAKVVGNSSSLLPAGDSTAREIYLYESMPNFSWHGQESLGFHFQLKNDFIGSVANYKHWSFLCFRENTQSPPANKFVDVRWPGSVSSGLAVSSFCDELLELVTHSFVQPVPANVYGAPLAPHPEWEKLAQQILHKAAQKPQSGHASMIKGQKANVLMCAMLAESHIGRPMWIDSQGHFCRAGCTTCFNVSGPEDIPYAFLSTGFNGYRPKFNLSLNLQEKWEVEVDPLTANNGRSGGGGGHKPPMGGGQGEGEDGGAGAKLTLFVDVAAVERQG